MRTPSLAALFALAACSGSAVEPVAPVRLEIDRSAYDAMPTSPSFGGASNVRFTIVARLVNSSTAPVSVNTCGGSRRPIYGVSLARGGGSMSSGYDLAWACPASEPLILAAGAERTDTLSIFGPTGRDGQTQAPLGALDGDFVLHYGTSAGTLNSAVFRVKRAPEDAAYVTLLNDGATTLTNVRVVTSEKDSVPLAMTLAPGQRLGPYRVAALHTNPYVAALLQGRSVVSHPVEGFSGFNPRLASGAYVVRLRTTTEGMLDVRVVQDGL